MPDEDQKPLVRNDKGRFAPGSGGRRKGAKNKPKTGLNLFESVPENLERFRSNITDKDIKDVYDRVLKDSLAGRAKSQELYLKYAIGMPPKVSQVHHSNVSDIMATLIAQRQMDKQAESEDERIENATVVDVE